MENTPSDEYPVEYPYCVGLSELIWLLGFKKNVLNYLFLFFFFFFEFGANLEIQYLNQK